MDGCSALNTAPRKEILMPRGSGNKGQARQFGLLPNILRENQYLIYFRKLDKVVRAGKQRFLTRPLEDQIQENLVRDMTIEMVRAYGWQDIGAVVKLVK